MSASYRVRHLTRYRYAHTVTLSHHAAHLRPRNLMRQTCHSTKLTINPSPASFSERFDFFGNTVTLFTVETGHTELEVISESVVTVAPPAPPPLDLTPPWEEAARLMLNPRGGEALQASAFLHASPMVPLLPEVRAYALESFEPGRPLLEAALELTRRIYRDFTYDSTATDNATPLGEVLESRHGVCQDFAHVQIAALRSLGLPARYVSGYIRTYQTPKKSDSSKGEDGKETDEVKDEADAREDEALKAEAAARADARERADEPARDGLAGEEDGPAALIGGDASHAWVSLWIPGNGWVDLDPTNDKLALDEHVTVAWGRDFEDVSPIKGVMVGGGDHTIDVSVAVIPVDSAGLLGVKPPTVSRLAS